MDKVKKAGDIMSALFRDQFDPQTLKDAKITAGLFSAWDRITGELGIPAAAAHSRVRELERGVLLVEAEHPGWVQLFQTRQKQLLNTVQRKYPELNIEGVSFCLSRDPIFPPTPSAKPAAAPESVTAASNTNSRDPQPVLTEENKALHESMEKLRKVLQKRSKKYPDSVQ